MTYVPTVWVNYGPPGVSAANLNNMEGGIDRAQGDIMVLFGLTADLPASDPLLVGRLYFESDLLRRAWRDNGAGWDLVIACDPTGLPVTGQTTQYGGYEDDGFYQLGLPEDWTILTAGQYAGTTAITLFAKVENHTNNCVIDNRYGLMWSREVSGPNVGPANDGRLPWDTNVNGEGIYTYVAAANAVSLAGYNDWRVPNKQELMSLMNDEAPASVPDAVAFPAWPADNVWSSTTQSNLVTSAYRPSFAVGDCRGVVKTNTYYCALVRG